MQLGVTGHRLSKLGMGYTIPNAMYSRILQESEQIILTIKPDKIITGMCIGYDQIIAELALKLNIPFVAAIPFVGQELLWPKDIQECYRSLLAQAEHIEVVNPGGFASWKMQARNKWIVDHSDVLLALFAGIKGGTYNCIEYAKEIQKPIKIIDPLINTTSDEVKSITPTDSPKGCCGGGL